VDDVAFIPISALLGDNVVDHSEHTPWYAGAPLLAHLENVHPEDDRNLEDLRFPVQLVIRDPATDYRGYAGQLASGVLRPGDEVTVLPSGVEATVAAVETYDGPLDEALPPRSVTVLLEEDVDVSRGDVLVHRGERPEAVRELEADICWFSEPPMVPGGRYVLKHLTQQVDVVVDQILDVVDVHTLDRGAAPAQLELNDIGRVRLRTRRPLVVDPYARNRVSGAFILIDEATNDTVAGGMVAS
jgi:bifunctional enzyme CysN/CysC